MVELIVAGKRRGALLLLLGLTLVLAGCASGGGNHASIADGGGWVTVQRGDTLGRIASQAGVPLLRLQRFNPGVDSRRLAVGQRLLLPSQQERAPGGGPYRYQVRRGDSLYSIARYFGANPQRVQAANTGIDPSQLAVGQLIQIPLAGGSASRRTPPTPAASRSLPDPGPLPSSASQWRWPLDDYTIERRFGRDAHGTLQPMMLSTPSPATAKATTSGKVRFASGMRQLGQVVILHHADNMQSVYAFCDRLMVSEGQSVSAGTPLCEIGKENGSSRYHLLFDLRHGGKPVDPAGVLR
ncbi:LysM peptidoglycan-binding domain-containing protein [Salinicola corii]|uniref:LysM peptidoglycan-binding domain-containing protein n=1 Tax=Salinicola corii TaxID=2606937 RepID=A0A640WGD6_9GAMM|nr:LysM peptidoglycan-binding domain-containing protein [Salinicola corii]KAA0019313.1 LysM peptidoglycan-binding domain-containing protein [Salinicola corii]